MYRSRRITEALRKHSSLSLDRAPVVLERALFLSLFTYYDAFLGHLLKEIYLLKPELLGAIDREYKASDVLSFASIEELKGC